jgi:hypothetical protein
MRTYVGQVDEGLGDAAFLDELIPVEEEGGGKGTPANRPSGSGEPEQADGVNPPQISEVPQTAADGGAFS